MKPISFKEQNHYSQDAGIPLYEDGSYIITCWKLSLRERLKAVFAGRIWLSIAGNSMPPIALLLDKPFRRYRYEATPGAAPIVRGTDGEELHERS